MLKLVAIVALAAVLGTGSTLADTPRIQVEALFTGAAVLQIDGQRKTLRVGESYGGVKLLAARSQTCTLEVDGVQTVLGISRRIGSNFEQPKEQVVTIQRDAKLLGTRQRRHGSPDQFHGEFDSAQPAGELIVPVPRVGHRER